MRVRRATAEDLPRIVAIYNHAIEHTTATFDTEPFTVEARRTWFARFDDDNPLFVAEENDLLGFAYYAPYRPKPGYAHTKETTVYVDPKAVARGIGHALYEALIAHAREHNVHVLMAVLAGDNPASVALHQKHGFTEVGRLREVGHKHGSWIDTTYWHLLLR